jgi:ubiquinone/menaquinone biosynthesis C-methylase UbiE
VIFPNFKTRSLETERLDRGEFTFEEYKLWRKEMWFLHRHFGEVRALKKSLLTDVRKNGFQSMSVLELAAGTGVMLKYLNDTLCRGRLKCVGLEISEVSARDIRDNGLAAVRANATELPFADQSFDFAFCTLFLHHLDESHATALLREMRRVARRKIYVVDLDRRAVPYFFYKLFGYVFLQDLTREDGALSIRRAYRASELWKLARSSDLKNVVVERSAINRLVLTADV